MGSLGYFLISLGCSLAVFEGTQEPLLNSTCKRTRLTVRINIYSKIEILQEERKKENKQNFRPLCCLGSIEN